MDHVQSGSQKDILDQIELMVKNHPIKVSREQLKDLLKWIQEQFPNEELKSLFNPYFWDSVNLRLYNAAIYGDLTAAMLLCPGRVVHEVVKQRYGWQAENKDLFPMAETKFIGEKQGLRALTPPTPERVGIKPEKTEKKSQREESVPSSASAEQMGGFPNSKSLGLSGNNPGLGTPEACLPQKQNKPASFQARELGSAPMLLICGAEQTFTEAGKQLCETQLGQAEPPRQERVNLVPVGEVESSLFETEITAEAGIKPCGTPESRAVPPGHEGVNATPPREPGPELTFLQVRCEGEKLSVQENGGAHVTSVNNAYVLPPAPRYGQQDAGPPAAAPPLAASIIAPSNNCNLQPQMLNTNHFTEKGRREDMNTALKLGERASFQNPNSQDKSNFHTTNGQLASFPSGTRAIPKKKKRKKASKEMFTYWDDIRRRALKKGDLDMTITQASTLGEQFEKFLEAAERLEILTALHVTSQQETSSKVMTAELALQC